MRTPAPLPRPVVVAPHRTGQARLLGASAKRLRGADVVHPFHGVVAVADPLDVVERCGAYLPRLPPGGFFSGPTAAALHGFPVTLTTPLLHVSVPAPGRAPRGRGIVGHSVRLTPGDVTIDAGLPVSVRERAWCELAGDLDVEELVVAGDWIAHTSPNAEPLEVLRRTLDAYAGRRGRGCLEQAFALIDPRAESPQESRLRFRLAIAGVRGFRANPAIATSSGRRYRGDIVFPGARVILEYQGDHHRDQATYRKDLSRRLDLQADGWTIVELGPHDIDDPGLVRRVRAIVALSSHRRSGTSG